MEAQEIRDKLRGYVVQELLNRPEYPLGDDEPLITGGLMDSFSLARVAVFIEGTLGVYLPDNELTVENMDTLNKMVERIQAAGAV